MTRLFLYTVSVFLSTALMLLLIHEPEPPVFRAITVPEHVVALMDDSGFALSVWVNRIDHPLVDPDVITRARITNGSETTSLDIVLTDAQTGHTEPFQGKTFTLRRLIFDAPRLTDDFVIKEAWLSLELTDGSAHSLMIGTFELIRIEQSWKELPFHDLHGEKDHGNALSRIRHVRVATDHRIVITEARIGTLLPLTWDTMETDVTLSVPADTLVLTRFPVLIRTETSVFYIPAFVYVKDMRVLEAHEEVLHVHTFD